MTHLHTLLCSLKPQSRRENVLKTKYPEIHQSILEYCKNHSNIPFKQKVFNYINFIKDIPTCKMCSEFVKMHNNKYSIYCSSNCQFKDEEYVNRALLASRKSMMKKFGVDSAFKIAGKHIEMREANIERWGTDNPAKLQSIKEKISKTKKNKTLVKYNVGSINLLSIDENRVMEIICDSCCESYKINYTTFLLRKKNGVVFCTKCNTLNNYKSSALEKDVLEFISTFGFECKSNQKIGKYEIDIYLPELKLGFEFNGLYWHSESYKERMYHLNKTSECLKRGINLFHIWEDDWIHKNEIVKSIIVNKLKKTQNRIFARNCQIKIIADNRIIREFLEKNHIQGFVGSKVKIGLYYKDELVSLMTFGNLRKSLGSKTQEGIFEMLRFCNKLDTMVVGSASKIFKYFVKNYEVKSVISYSDSSRSIGDLYRKLGFDLLYETMPNYYWIINGMRHHRFNFRKDKLVKEGFDVNKTEIQIMYERGSVRIFNCGSKKWIFNKT